MYCSTPALEVVFPDLDDQKVVECRSLNKLERSVDADIQRVECLPFRLERIANVRQDGACRTTLCFGLLERSGVDFTPNSTSKLKVAADFASMFMSGYQIKPIT